MVEVLWKFCAVVVNCRLKMSVALHEALNGFRTGRGKGMATLEAKLYQQLAGLTQNPLFQVFLDIRKAYKFLDREW